jgi:hypothetical protein
MATAEEFARRLMVHLADTLIAPKMSPREAKANAISLIEADRAAAKLEVLEEMRLAMNAFMKGKGLYVDPGEALAHAYDEARAKYAGAK